MTSAAEKVLPPGCSERRIWAYSDPRGAYDAGTSTPSWRAWSRGHNLLAYRLRVPAPTARRRWLPINVERHPPMKIALVAQHSTPIPGTDTTTAGRDARVVEMSKSLAGEGHQVTVYARRNGSGLPARAELAPGVSVEYVGPAGSGADDSRLAAQVGAFSAPLHDMWAKDRPDVVH